MVLKSSERRTGVGNKATCMMCQVLPRFQINFTASMPMLVLLPLLICKPELCLSPEQVRFQTSNGIFAYWLVSS
jgi:hypothetical protein